MASKKLTDLQQRFVDEYLIDLNATQAAIRAGYKHPDIGRRIITKSHVLNAINAAKSKCSRNANVTAERVVDELACMAFYDPADMVRIPVKKPGDIVNLPEPARRAIVGWSWDKFGNFVLRLASKERSLELLGKHLGMFDRSAADSADAHKDITINIIDDPGPVQ
jgi:phage terminase small subunit